MAVRVRDSQSRRRPRGDPAFTMWPHIPTAVHYLSLTLYLSTVLLSLSRQRDWSSNSKPDATYDTESKEPSSSQYFHALIFCPSSFVTSCLIAEAADSKKVDAFNVNDMGVMVMLLMVEGREKLA